MTLTVREMQCLENKQVFSLEIQGENPAHQGSKKQLTSTMEDKWLTI